MMTLSRRQILKSGAALSLTSALKPEFAWSRLASADVDVELKITSHMKEFDVFSGPTTKMWVYEGELIKGPAESLTPSPQGSFLGPHLKFRTGQRVRIHYFNQLPEASTIHWHGLHVPADQDGHPMHAVPPGGSRVYDFIILNRAGLYWYHPHPHMRTGFQVFMGLAGTLEVSDEEEKDANLPPAQTFVIQDRDFDDDNQIAYIQSQHDQIMGKMGDHFILNGLLNNLQQTLTTGSHRIRILNGSNARFYNLKWSDGRPLIVIGTDGGLLEKHETHQTLFLGPAERLDLWVDIDTDLQGQSLQLMNVSISEGRAPRFALADFKIAGQGEFYRLPKHLSVFERISPKEAINAENPKVFRLIPSREHGWTFDGVPYEMGKIREKERIRLGTTEIWEIDHTQYGMAHPIHLHGTSFQVLSRSQGAFPGACDSGWKDTVLVLPGDKVRIIKRFHDFPGHFMYHCHNLEHEDMSMMRDILVHK